MVGQIIGLCGLAGSGKDEVGKILVEKYGFVAIAIADPMKRFLMEMFDFSEEQLWGPSEERNKPDKRYRCAEHWWQDDSDLCLCCGVDVKDYLAKDNNPPCFLTPRHALQQLGTEWGRKCYLDVWVDYAMRIAHQILEEGKGYSPDRGTNRLGWTYGFKPEGVVITDIRMKNEVVGVKKAGGWMARVIRPGYDKPAYDHNTETEQTTIPDTEFNSLIINDKDLKYLESQVHTLMEVLK